MATLPAFRCSSYLLPLLLVSFVPSPIAFIITVIHPRAPSSAIATALEPTSGAEFAAGRPQPSRRRSLHQQPKARVTLALSGEIETGGEMGDDIREVRVLRGCTYNGNSCCAICNMSYH